MTSFQHSDEVWLTGLIGDWWQDLSDEERDRMRPILAETGGLIDDVVAVIEGGDE